MPNEARIGPVSRLREINVAYPLYGLSGITLSGGTKASQLLDTRGTSRALVMLCITGVTSAPNPRIFLAGYSAANASDPFWNVAQGGVTAAEVKRYAALAAAPGRECFWFTVFAPWTKVRVSMLGSGAGDKISISGDANSRPWIVLQAAIVDEDY